MRTTVTRTFLTAATCGLLVGCAHQSPPPSELAEARSIYGRASAGPAARHAPARLKLAKQALDSAEQAYGASPDAEVQDRAYVAIRRAQAAEAEASTIVASERRAAALRELATLTGAHADRARAELAGANQKATEAGQRADLAQAQVAAEQGRTQDAQQEAQQQGQRVQETEARLESEKQGRADAEARAQQAMTELARLAQVRQEARGLVITLSGQVLFVTNQAQLLPASQASLDGVATALKQVVPDAAGVTRVTIEGHSDSTGSRSYNVDSVAAARRGGAGVPGRPGRAQRAVHGARCGARSTGGQQQDRRGPRQQPPGRDHHPTRRPGPRQGQAGPQHGDGLVWRPDPRQHHPDRTMDRGQPGAPQRRFAGGASIVIAVIAVCCPGVSATGDHARCPDAREQRRLLGRSGPGHPAHAHAVARAVAR